jgi:hypothetical protein
MTFSVATPCISWHYAERHYIECCDSYIDMLNVVIMCVVIRSIVKPNVVMLSVVVPFLVPSG